MTPLLITIPGRPPTPNDRANWPEQARVRAEWKNTATLAAKYALGEWSRRYPGGRWKPLRKAAVGVTIVVPDRQRRDFDNGACSLKPLTDGIVAAGVLVDDSTDVIVSFGVAYRYERGASEVRYVISEVSIE